MLGRNRIPVLPEVLVLSQKEGFDRSSFSNRGLFLQRCVNFAMTRRVTATGRDIYAVSAPIIVEATERLLSGRTSAKGGVASLGEIFDAADFLKALDTVQVAYDTSSGPALRKRDAVA